MISSQALSVTFFPSLLHPRNHESTKKCLLIFHFLIAIMVSFNCNRCQDVVKKPKVPTHAMGCGGSNALFTCVDCMVTFDMNSVKNHTSCVTETDKYQGKWQQKRTLAADGSAEKKPKPKIAFPSYSDSDDDSGAPAAKKQRPDPTSAAPAKKAASASPVQKPKKSQTPVHKPTPKGKAEKDAIALPPSVTSSSSANSAVTVPAFELGPRHEVLEMIAAAKEAEGSDSAKVLARAFVSKIYTTKLVKALTPVIQELLDSESH